MDKKLLFVFNPHAGKAKIKTKLADIIDEFTKAGYWVTAYTTQDVEDAKRVVALCARQYDLIVCSGGDGTLNEVVNGLMEAKTDIPIGYIPAGSTNDYGMSLGIPKDMMRAAEIAVYGKIFQSDLGVMNGKSFIYVAAFGAFTEVSYSTNQQAKNILGHSAYILEGVKSISAIKTYSMRIDIDGEIIEGDFLYGMITNALSVGGIKNLAGKDVVLDDGLFEVVFISNPKNPLEFQELLTGLVIEGANSKCIYRFKAKNITIYSEEEVPWTLDGEYGGSHTQVDIFNIKQAYKIKVDEEKKALTTSEELSEEEEEEW